MIDRLWGGEPPPTAAKVLQVQIWRLRKALGRDALITRPPGYMLQVGPDELDLARFERLVEEAQSGEPGVAAAKLREALGLWRGDALADLTYESFLAAEIARLRGAATVGGRRARSRPISRLAGTAEVVPDLGPSLRSTRTASGSTAS